MDPRINRERKSFKLTDLGTELAVQSDAIGSQTVLPQSPVSKDNNLCFRREIYSHNPPNDSAKIAAKMSISPKLIQRIY